MRGYGCIGHPAFPAPFVFSEGDLHKARAQSRCENAELCLFSLAPFLRGEGWGEGLYPRIVLAESPPHPPDFAEPVIGRACARPVGFAGRPLPASAFARRRASADKSGAR